MSEDSPSAPPASQRFEPTVDAYGLRLAWVFGNEAPDGVCPFVKADRCHHCDIGLGEGREFSTSDNLSRLDWLQTHYARVLPTLAHLVIYNSGSTLNAREFSTSTLDGILQFAANLPRLRIVSLDTREGFLDGERLRTLAARLPDSAVLRPILGVESMSERIRNQLLQKAMSTIAIQRGLDEVAAACRDSGGRVGLDANILVGGPGAPGDAATEDAVESVAWLLHECQRRSLPIDFNLHPYYPSKRGLREFPDHPHCSWRQLCDAAIATKSLLDAATGPCLPSSQLFVGWQDEDHDQLPAARFERCSDWKQRLYEFNRTQAADVLVDTQ